MSLDFPAFALPEEHEALREAVRSLADDKIAPRAAEVDRTSEFPWDVYEALVKADLQAVHIPEAYGGAGADAIATAIVYEEGARACAASSLIPAVNKLGTVPLLLAGSEDLKQRYLPPVARGEVMFSYALSEPDAGSDAVAMKARAVRDGDSYVLNGTKRWITNAGASRFYTVMPVTDFQGVQFMLADMAMKLEAARQLTYAAAAKSERAMVGQADPDLTFFSSACKCLASDAAMAITTDAVQLLGGYGYSNDYPVERMM